jgi:ubiquinone/menaquinone biosynthesis C-methylase UbiE
MDSSAEISRLIYEQLGSSGLAARTTAEWDAETVALVKSFLSSGQRILDLGCGYGRIAIPLAEAGFEVVGLDISRLMLDEAKDRAEASETPVQWIQADICQIPFPDCSFDVVLCLWLTFHELLEEREQVASLREMCRVLRPGGWALLDGPPYHDVSDDTDDRLEVSFERLLQQVGINLYHLFVDDCPGRPRQFLRFTRESTPTVP